MWKLLALLFITSYCQLVRVIPDPTINPTYCNATGCCDVLFPPAGGIIVNAVPFSPSQETIPCTNMNASQVAYFNSLRQFGVIVQDDTYGTGTPSSCSITIPTGTFLYGWRIDVTAAINTASIDISSCTVTLIPGAGPTPLVTGSTLQGLVVVAQQQPVPASATAVIIVIGVIACICVGSCVGCCIYCRVKKTRKRNNPQGLKRIKTQKQTNMPQGTYESYNPESYGYKQKSYGYSPNYVPPKTGVNIPVRPGRPGRQQTD